MQYETRINTSSTTAPRIARGRAGSVGTIIGHAAVFYNASVGGSEYRLPDGVIERIRPGAFAKVIRSNPDTLALLNHNADLLLGRRSAGTLRMSEDSIGLRYEIDLPDVQIARDVAEHLRVGNLSGSSFSFRVASSGETYDRSGSTIIRWIGEVSHLWDLGPVSSPAYTATAASLKEPLAGAASADADDLPVAVKKRLQEINDRANYVAAKEINAIADQAERDTVQIQIQQMQARARACEIECSL